MNPQTLNRLVNLLTEANRIVTEEQRRYPVPSFERLVNAVSCGFDVPVADLKSNTRCRRICDAKHALRLIAKQQLGMTAIELQRIWGLKDWGGIINSWKVAKALWQTDRAFAKKAAESVRLYNQILLDNKPR